MALQQRDPRIPNPPNFLAVQDLEAEAYAFASQSGMLNQNRSCANCHEEMTEVAWHSAHGINEGKF
jgi:hypothetical protein